MLSLSAMTSADLGPRSKRAISPKQSPGARMARTVSLPAIIRRTRRLAVQHQVHAVVGIALFEDQRPLADGLQLHITNEAPKLFVVQFSQGLDPAQHARGVMPSCYGQIGLRRRRGRGRVFLRKKSWSSGRVSALRQRSFWLSNTQVAASTRPRPAPN